MSILYFVVPGAPVPCARARVFTTEDGKKRAATPRKTRAYEEHVATLARFAANRDRWVTPEVAEYRIHLRIFREANRGDWDNFAKAITDGMKGIAWVDDRQIVEARVVMAIDRKSPRVEVTVERLEVA